VTGRLSLRISSCGTCRQLCCILVNDYTRFRAAPVEDTCVWMRPGCAVTFLLFGNVYK